jgi:choline-sulfatase
MPLKDLFANGNTPNILILITDQERSIAEWPPSYRSTLSSQLIAMKRLMANGLSFNNAYTAASMCSPSRATLLTSQYPIVTGCTTTGQSSLPKPSIWPNIATVLTAANYSCYWIGKWHLLGSKEPGSGASDLATWGFRSYPHSAGPSIAWDPPDAGINLATTYLGGGTQGASEYNRNDQRYIGNALSFLTNPPASPWCLVVSLVNPHDVHLGYEAQDGAFYDSSKYQNMNVPLPDGVQQSPTTMPRGQNYYTWDTRAVSGATQQDFANFYAYLMTYIDGQIGSILGAMSQSQVQDTLIIRFADHGEMGLAHGLVEKFVNAYRQCMHVPLIFSNPVAYPSAQSTDAMASTVDLAPTLAGLLGVSSSFPKFVGKDLGPVLEDPSTSVQDYVHFTYDDLSGTSGPSVIRTIRSKRWMYSVYLQSVTSQASGYADTDWEMYDLEADPNERENLAGQGRLEQATLDRQLQEQMLAKGTAPAWYSTNWPPTATACSRGGPPPADEVYPCPVAKIPGIDATQAERLTYAGVPDSTALLARTGRAEDRKALASIVPVEERSLEAWIESARRLQRLAS